jgi:hypothetical protein
VTGVQTCALPISAADLERAAGRLGATHVLLSTRLSDNAWDLTGSADHRQRVAGWKARLEAWAQERLKPLACRGQLCLYELPAKERP